MEREAAHRPAAVDQAACSTCTGAAPGDREHAALPVLGDRGPRRRWDACASTPAPHWDLSLVLHDLGIDGKDAFLAGDGLPQKALVAALPFLAFWNVLDLARAVEQAVANTDRATLDSLRTWLRTGLDLSI